MRSLNLDQLRALEAVVSLGSFTAAAHQLHLTQSAVSVQIRELEERCGVRLVERLGKKAFATEAGRVVIAHARRIAAEADLITTEMKRFREGWIGRVHIGAALTALMYLLPPALQKLHAEHRGIDLHVTNATSAEMVASVARNELDIGVVTLPVSDSRIAITPLYVEDMVAILPATMQDIPDEVTPDYVAGQFLVLEFGGVSVLITNWMSEAGCALQSSMKISAIEAAKSVVSSGLGISIVPAMAMSQNPRDLIVRPLKPRLTRTLALIQHRNKPDNLALRLVREALMTLSNVKQVESA